MLQLDPSLAEGSIEVDLGTTVAVSAKAVAPSTPVTVAATPTAHAPTTPAPTTGAPVPAVHASTTVAPATTVPTPDGNPVSASADQEQPWDPRAC
jgi:hypothetical protein